MRILFLEDKAAFADEFAESLEHALGGAKVTIVGDALTAVQAVEREWFDLAICDLQVPPKPGSADLSTAHGRNAIARMQELASGMPIVILSGFADLDTVNDLMANAGREDISGSRVLYPMLQVRVKGREEEVTSTAREVHEAVRELSDVSIEGLEPLQDWERRVLQLCGRRSAGRRVAYSVLAGGLSGNRVFRATVYDDDGLLRASVAVKIARVNEVRDERRRLQGAGAALLGGGTIAQFVDEVTGGSGPHGGLAIRFLEGEVISLFDLITQNQDRAVEAIGQLRAALANWLSGAPTRTSKVGEIRALAVADDALAPFQAELDALERRSFEDRKVQVRIATQHGDMHGSNVQIVNGHPQLIDFARAGTYPAGLDAISLELSLAFHPGIATDTWPTPANADAWPDPAAFAAGSPHEKVIQACRLWARQDAGSDRAMMALAYAWALRQLKFPGTDKGLALRIAKAAMSSF